MTPTNGFPLTRDLLLIGGGHAHALILRAWAMRPLPGARLTVVSPSAVTAYSGMLPGAIAGLYDEPEIFIDLVKLCRAAGARLVIDRVVGLDPAAGAAALAGRPPVPYDVASIDVGAGTAAPTLDDPAQATLPVKPVEPFLAGVAHFARAVADGAAAPSAAVIGGGVGGVETAFALRRRLHEAAGPERASQVAVTLLARSDRVAPTLTRSASAAITRRLAEAGVTVATGAEAVRVTPGAAHLADGRAIQASLIVVAAGARAPDWLADTGLALDPSGFIAVDACLRAAPLRGADAAPVFAAGDAATITADPREKAGVYAVRAAGPLGRNLRRALQGLAPEPARLQRRHLKLISLGDGRAIAERQGVLIGGPPALGRALWRLKDGIDRAFMRKLTPEPLRQTTPPRRAPAAAATGLADQLQRAPLCAGCGSKIGRAPLKAALAALGPVGATSVSGGVSLRAERGDDAAVLGFGAAGAPELVLSVDGFRAFTDDPRLFAEITVAHAFGDVFAKGAEPVAALADVTLPAMSAMLQERTLRDLMSGVDDALKRLGARLIGGHSAEGAELSLSITAIGRLAPGGAIGLAGAQPGDRLWLSRPIGAGVILAGEMRLEASGRDVAALYARLRDAAAPEAAALRCAGARAMTDVTGFGLIGHALGLAEASGVAIDVSLAAVPLHPGAEALAAAGVRSSIFEHNARFEPDAVAVADGVAGPRCDLLFDPQTSGGLLAALPPQARVSADFAAPIGVVATEGPSRARLRVLP